MKLMIHKSSILDGLCIILNTILQNSNFENRNDYIIIILIDINIWV